MKKEKGKAGRPSKYTPELVAEICTRLSTGEPLAQICRDAHMPSDHTVRIWADGDEAISSAIARAREAGFDAIANACLEIADDARNDFIEKLAGEGDEGAVKAMAFNAEHVQRSKLRVETRLKLLAKWDPKRYGDKMAVTDGDGKPLNAIPPVFNITLS
ncbi:hypothetical protein RD110_08020 [Rhodoferax koreense]|uniref:Terminase small subunit n=1 Tax=Rhodoferax koreensis TaxID=1842727 RepID=A0A1P8JTQ2_9BURK|nr:hypothetical protein [Rhodoferax koreense]APW37150.1 hypothetical protein RD110_08020 [Rhodoferax koreense]